MKTIETRAKVLVALRGYLEAITGDTDGVNVDEVMDKAYDLDTAIHDATAELESGDRVGDTLKALAAIATDECEYHEAAAATRAAIELVTYWGEAE